MIISLVLFYTLICTRKIKSIVCMSKLCLDVNFCHEDSRKRVLKILLNHNTVSGTSLEPFVSMFLSSLGVCLCSSLPYRPQKFYVDLLLIPQSVIVYKITYQAVYLLFY